MRIRYKGEGREEQGRISGTDEAKRKRKEDEEGEEEEAQRREEVWR